MRKSLTVASVARVQPKSERFEVADSIVPGLRLVVFPTGTKSFVVRFRDQSGKSKKLTLVGVTSLAEARDRARSALGQVTRGETPTRSSDAIETVVADYIEKHCKRHNKTWAAVEASFRRDLLPRWQGRRITDIRKRDVVELVDSVLDRNSPVQANRLLAQTATMLRWAVARDLISSNPAEGIRMPTKEVARERVLTLDEVRKVWEASAEYPFGSMTRVLVLTATRLREAAHAEWDEVHLSADNSTWVIPASRSKNGRQNVIPVVPKLATLLENLPKFSDSPYLFTTVGTAPISGFSRWKARLDERVGFEDWTLHDIRRTVASSLARLGTSLPAVERLLNHSGHSFKGIVSVYQKHDFADEIRAGLEKWSAELP